MPKKSKTSNEMPDLYHIKFWPKGNPDEVYFGEVERYDRDAEKEWENGNLIVSDAITGEPQLVPVDQIEYGEQDPETRMPISTEYDRHILKAYKEHVRRDKEAGEGLKKDRMFSMPVADGCACYVVTKVNKKTCRIEWRNFGADRYYDRVLGWGGTFDKSIIEQQVGYADGRRKLFG
jgi:hypothetical protein